MIAGLAALLGCQLAGEVLVRLLAVPLPGPVAGLGLLFTALVVRDRRLGGASAAQSAELPSELGQVSDVLLRNLSLLFIPASVGIVKYLDVLRSNAISILITIAVSTALALVVTAVTFRCVSRFHAFRHASLAQEVEQAAERDDLEGRT